MNVQSCTKATISLCLLALLLIPLIPLVHAPLKRLRELGEWYLHDEESGIENYQTWWINKPNNIYPAVLNRTLDVGYYFVKGFISNPIPFSITLKPPHNWLAKLYVVRQNTSLGSITVEIWGYRNGHEKFVFRMDTMNISWTGEYDKEEQGNRTSYVWQSKDFQEYQIQENDRIICKLFLNVTEAGWFAFAYDHRLFPSSVSDPTEIMFFRSDLADVNGLNTEKLRTS